TKTPLNKWIKDYWKPWLYGLGRTVVLAIGNYFFIAYFATFLVKQGGFTLNEAMVINVISTAIFVIALPLFGLLSDKIGRKPVMLLGAVLFIIFAIPIFWLMLQQNFGYALTAEILFV